ncbi:MAG: hypothetical protein FWD67_08270 [Betaproteobacteria bacterium]|nr:hypothetical protein [Betaproteobacteria bacterium]
MKLRMILLMFSAGILALPSAYADDFDIAGVRIGMDYDQAQAAAAKHLKAALSEFKPGFGNFTSSVSDSDRRIKAVTGAKHPSFFTYDKNKVKLTIDFEPRVPFNKAHPLTVVKVTYEIPRSEENNAAMEKAALAKYGEPTSAMGKIFKWCAKPNKLTRECVMSEGQVLELFAGKMTLIDMTLEMAVKQHVSALEAEKVKATPNL